MAPWALAALAAILVVGVAARPTTQAQDQLRIAFLNTELILRQTPGYAAAESTFNAEMEAFRQEVQGLQTQLDSVVRDFDQQSIVLSPTSRQEKIQEIRGMQQRFEQRSGELQQRAQQRRQELVAPLEERIQSVIDGVRAERNLALIFDVAAAGNNIIAADRALDLSPTIIRRLRGDQEPQQPQQPPPRPR
jgi:outer membrane protein